MKWSTSADGHLQRRRIAVLCMADASTQLRSAPPNFLPPTCNEPGHRHEAICQASVALPYVVLVGYAAIDIAALRLGRKMRHVMQRRVMELPRNSLAWRLELATRNTTTLFFGCLILFSGARVLEMAFLIPVTLPISWPSCTKRVIALSSSQKVLLCSCKRQPWPRSFGLTTLASHRYRMHRASCA